MARTFAYPYGRGLYLNVTNRCVNRCPFCIRGRGMRLGPYDLRLDDEPTVADIMAAVETLAEPFDEVVFCGMGEPLLRPEVVGDVARQLAPRGAPIRVNTSGVVPTEALLPLVDAVQRLSVSLNAPDATSYAALCRPLMGPAAFGVMRDFVAAALARRFDLTLTAVALPNVDLAACAHVAEQWGAPFRVREFQPFEGDAWDDHRVG